jgi:hypothetical protein
MKCIDALNVARRSASFNRILQEARHLPKILAKWSDETFLSHLTLLVATDKIGYLTDLIRKVEATNHPIADLIR